MAAYTLVKLKNMTPLHIGTGKENYDFSASNLHSDTLSAALAAIKSQTKGGGGIKEFLDSFVVSSAFPFVENRYFLPRPQGKLDVVAVDSDEYLIRKKLKKIKFVEIPLWNDLITGKTLHIFERQLKGDFLILDSADKDFDLPYVSQVNQRVAVPRGGVGETDPFYFEWTYFEADSGLYCLLDVADEKKQELISLFQELGEAGVGTDRNVGGGKFEVETTEFLLPEVNHANAVMLLSLYIPAQEEIGDLDLLHSRYELLLRGGYIAGSQNVNFRHLRKKSVYMFNVGSVFHTVRNLNGKIVDLRPDWQDERLHSVFRSGRPFIVPIKITGYE